MSYWIIKNNVKMKKDTTVKYLIQEAEKVKLKILELK